MAVCGVQSGEISSSQEPKCFTTVNSKQETVMLPVSSCLLSESSVTLQVAASTVLTMLLDVLCQPGIGLHYHRPCHGMH